MAAAVQAAKCARCDDTGFEPVNREGEPVPVGSPEQHGVRHCQVCLEKRRGFAPGVPDEERATDFSLYDKGQFEVTASHKNALQHARYFVQDVHPGLYIHGPVGCGKTSLACATINELHRAGRQVRFYSVPELLKRLVTEAGDAFLDSVIAVPFVVFDDVGAQQSKTSSDYTRTQLQMIFDARQARSHRTIWTSNLDLDELAAMLNEDERLPSRIAGAAKIVHLEGPDYRVRKAKRRK